MHVRKNNGGVKSLSGLLLIGGGGHCLTVIEALKMNMFEKVGIIDSVENIGKQLSGIPFIGCDNDLKSLCSNYDSAFISLGSIGNWKKRESLSKKIKNLKYKIPIVIHPKAAVSETAQIANGVLIGAMCVLNAYAEIGEMCILNNGCIVEHNCIVEAYVHISPGAVLCGGVHVGRGSHIGAGSVVKENISIGENSMIGIGSVVVSDIPDNVIAYGNPCRVQEG